MDTNIRMFQCFIVLVVLAGFSTTEQDSDACLASDLSGCSQIKHELRCDNSFISLVTAVYILTDKSSMESDGDQCCDITTVGACVRQFKKSELFYLYNNCSGKPGCSYNTNSRFVTSTKCTKPDTGINSDRVYQGEDTLYAVRERVTYTCVSRDTVVNFCSTNSRRFTSPVVNVLYRPGDLDLKSIGSCRCRIRETPTNDVRDEASYEVRIHDVRLNRPGSFMDNSCSSAQLELRGSTSVVKTKCSSSQLDFKNAQNVTGNDVIVTLDGLLKTGQTDAPSMVWLTATKLHGGGKPMQIDCTTNKDSSMADNPTDPETLVDKTAFIIIVVCAVVLLSTVVIAVLVVKRYHLKISRFSCLGSKDQLEHEDSLRDQGHPVSNQSYGVENYETVDGCTEFPMSDQSRPGFTFDDPYCGITTNAEADVSVHQPYDTAVNTYKCTDARSPQNTSTSLSGHAYSTLTLEEGNYNKLIPRAGAVPKYKDGDYNHLVLTQKQNGT